MDGERIPTMPQGGDERIPTMPQGADERIPTMPQGGDERVPTMPQGADERIPTMPQGADERIPTMPQGADGRVPTVPQGEDGRVATMPQNAQAAAAGQKKQLLPGKLEFTGSKGGSFTIDGAKPVSLDSGESEIYFCTVQGDDEKYAARILKSVTPDDSADRKLVRDKVIAFLDRLSGKSNSHILPLIDYGTAAIGGKNYYVEIYPYCEGGDLGRRQGSIRYDELKNEIIPAINEALHLFHKNGFVHRDLKPDNLYSYKGQIVLGDFGITCDLREDGFATDKYKTGTLGYYAPELMSQAAITASDYYSFGQTIWTLYSGEMMYRNILRRYKEYGIDEQRNQVNFAMLNNTCYGLDEIREEDAFFEILIRGLLQYDPTKRFDYTKVNRWLSGDRSLEHEIGSTEETQTFTRAMKLFGRECWDAEEVGALLCDNWEDAKEYLYNGYVKDFMASQSFEAARFLDSIMKQYAFCSDESMVTYQNNLGLAKAIMYLENNKNFCWCGQSFGSIRQFGQYVLRNMGVRGSDFDYYGLIRSRLMLDWYKLQRNFDENVLLSLERITGLFQRDLFCAQTAMYWLSLFGAGEDDKIFYADASDIEELTHNLLSEKNRIYRDTAENIPLVKDVVLMAVLCMWGYYEAVDIFAQSQNLPLGDYYDLFLQFLEGQCSDKGKELVRRYYHDYGPSSYLIWFQKNLSIYDIVGAECTRLRSEIESAVVDAAASLSDQKEQLAVLESLVSQLLEYDETDIFMAQLGLSRVSSDESITSSQLGAMWAYRFLDHIAPVGFKTYMEM